MTKLLGTLIVFSSLLVLAQQAPTTTSYQTGETMCSLDSVTIQAQCLGIPDNQGGTLDVYVSSVDVKNSTFSDGMVTWSPSNGVQLSCTGLNGSWDFPANGNQVVRYPTVVAGFCTGQDANGNNFSMNVVEFVSVYRNGDGQWVAKVRNGTLNITE
jgi:hypothetical protein